MAKVKLVAESFKEYNSEIKLDFSEDVKEEELNEGSKGQLQKFLKNPEKREKNFLAAFARQFRNAEGDKLKIGISKLPLETKKKLAQKSLKAFEEDPKKIYAWIQIRGGKVVGAGALGAKKGEVGSVFPEDRERGSFPVQPHLGQ
jgi:hypothetical protein